MRSNRIWIFVLTALALLAFLAMLRGVSRAMKMQTEAATRAQVSHWKPGDAAKVVLELNRVSAGLGADGLVLEKKTETTYRRTSESVRVTFGSNTPIVMGKAEDLRTGAVVHVNGPIGNDRALHAAQIVVLTGYVQVQ